MDQSVELACFLLFADLKIILVHRIIVKDERTFCMHCENVHLCLKSDDLQRRLNNSTVLNNPIDILFLAEQALRLDRKDFAFLKKKNEVDIVLALRSTNY